jgi:DNA polymerase III subunit gamma/tau
MKQLPLQEKYRPKLFAQLIGQYNSVIILQNSIRFDRLQPTYLFAGQKGTGKTSAARIFARSLNCLNRNNAEPCNKCTNCINHLNGKFLDVKEINGADNNGVDDVRELIETSALSPIVGLYKITIIDEAHMLSNSAQNALLKLLEEPPQNTLFLLCTTDLDKIIPTVRSRSKLLHFKAINNNELSQYLVGLTQLENIPLTIQQAEQICRHHDGSIRDCLQTLDSIVLGADLEGICPSLPNIDIHNLVISIINNRVTESIAQGKNLLDRNLSPEFLIKEIIAYLIESALQDPLSINPNYIERLISILLTKQQQLRYSPNAKNVFLLAVTMAATVSASDSNNSTVAQNRSHIQNRHGVLSI